MLFLNIVDNAVPFGSAFIRALCKYTKWFTDRVMDLLSTRITKYTRTFFDALGWISKLKAVIKGAPQQLSGCITPKLEEIKSKYSVVAILEYLRHETFPNVLSTILRHTDDGSPVRLQTEIIILLCEPDSVDALPKIGSLIVRVASASASLMVIPRDAQSDIETESMVTSSIFSLHLSSCVQNVMNLNYNLDLRVNLLNPLMGPLPLVPQFLQCLQFGSPGISCLVRSVFKRVDKTAEVIVEEVD